MQAAVRARRGRSVSAADISVPAPTSCTSDGPNIVAAASSGDPVCP